MAGLAPTLLRGDAYLAARRRPRGPRRVPAGARSSRHRSVRAGVPARAARARARLGGARRRGEEPPRVRRAVRDLEGRGCRICRSSCGRRAETRPADQPATHPHRRRGERADHHPRRGTGRHDRALPAARAARARQDTTIYRARDLRLDRDVAVKLLSPELAEPPRRATASAAKRTSPRSSAIRTSARCTIQARRTARRSSSASCWPAGHSTRSWRAAPLRGRARARPRHPARGRLAAVHRRGLVHGNIKPSNVFITDDGHVKLLELGRDERLVGHLRAAGRRRQLVARPPSVDQRAPSDTDVDGFHSYRSPEHLAGERLDHRSDIFSIGAVLYEMATGQRAFPGDTPSRIAAAIVSGTPVAVSRWPRRIRRASSRSSIARWRRTRPTATRAPPTCSPICAAPAAGGVGRQRDDPGGAAAPSVGCSARPRPLLILARRRRLVVVADPHGRADRSACAAHRQHRQRHQRSRLRRHAAPGADRPPRTVAVPRHRVRRARARHAADDGAPGRQRADPRRRPGGLRRASRPAR